MINSGTEQDERFFGSGLCETILNDYNKETRTLLNSVVTGAQRHDHAAGIVVAPIHLPLRITDTDLSF